MIIQPGQMPLHYRLVDKIGEGGRGVVWKAFDTSLDREVAVKILPDALAGDAQRLTRFEREAKLLAALNHTNIVSAVDTQLDRDVALKILPDAFSDEPERQARFERSADRAAGNPGDMKAGNGRSAQERRYLVAILIMALLVLGTGPTIGSTEADERAKRQLTQGEWVEDIDSLVRELEKRHPAPYHAISRKAFHDRAQRLRETAASASAHEMTLGLASLMASLEETHSYLHFWSNTDGQMIEFGEYGIRLAPFSDGFFVTATASSRSYLRGSRVVSIGGLPTKVVFARLTRIYVGDNPYAAYHVNPRFLSMPEVLIHLGVAESDGTTRLEVEARDGASRVEVLTPLRAEPITLSDSRSQERLRGSLFWRDPDRFYWAIFIPEHRAAYLQFNVVDNGEDSSLGEFADQVGELIERNSPERIILDLRRNNGGNSRLARPLIRELISCDVARRPGGLVVLIAEPVLSASVVFLTELEKYVPLTYIGRPTGSNRAQWGDNALVPLPNSKIPVSYSTAFYAVGGPYPPRGAILPHLHVEPTGQEFLEVEDPVLNAAFHYVPSGGVEGVYKAARKDGRNPVKAVVTFVEDDRHEFQDFERPLRLLADQASEEIGLEAGAELTGLLVSHHPDRARSYMAHAGSLEALGDRRSAVELWRRGLDTIAIDTSLHLELKRRLLEIATSETERLQRKND